MTVITLVKYLPTSLYYSGSAGNQTISLVGVNNITINSKKLLTKIQIPKTKSNQESTTTMTDQANNQVIDLKKLEQVIKFTGWLEDDDTETAWNKFWKLVGMQSKGGPLYSLTIGTSDPLIFPTSNGSTVSTNPVYPTTTSQAFIESITGIVESDDTGDITASHAAKPARIKVDLDIYLGYER